MSYASVAAHNAPSPQDQPRPDPSLLTTDQPTGSTIIDGTSKLNVVSSSDFKENPHTDAEFIQPDSEGDGLPKTGKGGKRPTPSGNKKRKQQAREKAMSLWEHLSDCIVRPQVAGGLLGIGRQYDFTRLACTDFTSCSSERRPHRGSGICILQ